MQRNGAHGVIHTERSVGEILRDIASHTEQFVRAEIQLGIAELREEVSGVVRRGMFIVAGVLLGMLALGLLLMAAVFALALVVQLWLAALIVGFVVALVAAGLLKKGSQPSSTEVKPVPEAAAEKRDRSWAIARAN